MSLWPVLKAPGISHALLSNLLQCFGIHIVIIFPLYYLVGTFFNLYTASIFCPLQSWWRGHCLDYCSLQVWLIVHISGHMGVLASLTLVYCIPFFKGSHGGLSSAATEYPPSCSLSASVQQNGWKKNRLNHSKGPLSGPGVVLKMKERDGWRMIERQSFTTSYKQIESQPISWETVTLTTFWVLFLSIISYIMKYPSGQFWSAVLAGLCPPWFCLPWAWSLSGEGNVRNRKPWHSAVAKTLVCYQHYFSHKSKAQCRLL